ncbi:hypothetical protein LZ575_07355 [Antarcticibacterium sp. 1MA-6-2]|uniref:hypothetical protein n=1 Tax=Antarcticibacterium sp. 1MA-6-2 TaxID=2908210 RepID=UPI001F48E317|nr:hypothetical protein [Antarcticibacterium sp. 1MA-6-2]UJH92337.1 hypothetical protein LZ575_07355 [Antarcticibacterium sp. 1MA-6-2]
MAQLDVEPKKNNDWWKWVIGILAIIIIIWVIVEATGTDDADAIDDMQEPVTESPATSYISEDNTYTVV